MWRRRKEKCGFGIYRTRKQAFVCSPGSGSCLRKKTQSQKNGTKVSTNHTPHSQNPHIGTSAHLSPLRCENRGPEEPPRKQNCLLNQCEFVSPPETLPASSSIQTQVTDTNVTLVSLNQTVPSQKEEALVQTVEMPGPEVSLTVKPLLAEDDACAFSALLKKSQILLQSQRPEVDETSEQWTTTTLATNSNTAGGFTSTKTMSSQADVNLKALTKHIHEFLVNFYCKYGSFIPLQKIDILRYLKRRCKADIIGRSNFIFSEVSRCRIALLQKSIPSFKLVYKKHTLTLDDLSTLADQNWLNDQVMNMYGELIMESAHHKVHFLNSFFHRQLMTKGYEGVKRWTKQVDLFSKNVILVPIHLEVHWCLVSADIIKKKICLYDSQGNALQKIGRNILKYLMTEAKEKNQTEFESGWVVSFDEEVPQQTNENDCGVFVLEYSRCLALAKPLQFSQKDIPNIRKRIYKELCECKLCEQG